MSVGLDTSLAPGWSGLQTHNFSFTVGSNSNRLLVARIVQTAGSTPVFSSSMTYNGVSLSYSQQSNDINHDAYEEAYLVAPATGTNTFSVTFSPATPNEYYLCVYSFYNAAQSAPTSFTDTFGTGTSSSKAVSVTTTGSAILSQVYLNIQTVPTPSNLTKTDGATDSVDSDAAATGYLLNASSGSNTVGWSGWSSSAYSQLDSVIAPYVAPSARRRAYMSIT